MYLCEFKDSLVYRVILGQRYIQRTCLKKPKLKVKIKEIEVEIKPHKDGKYTENLDLCVVMLSLNCLNAEERATAAKRYLLINAVGLIQPIYFSQNFN